MIFDDNLVMGKTSIVASCKDGLLLPEDKPKEANIRQEAVYAGK